MKQLSILKSLERSPGKCIKEAGCNMCANTGFRGRVALFELLVMSEDLRRLVLSGASADQIRAVALKEGIAYSAADGMLKAKTGNHYSQ